jgi:D-alanyl-D-alanine carboxypeptidase (penicillin-binding protein 5/6)
MRFKGLVGVFSTAVALAAALPAAAQAPATATASSLLGQPKYAAMLLDAKSGEVLYTRQADATRFPASITKVMTLYLAFEQMAAGRLKLSDRIVISRTAANARPSKLGLKPGETISVDECIRAIALKSANDMAVALAEHLGGSESAFASTMTARARSLGMSGTTFVNASGLPDPRHVSTARDIATLSRAMIRSFPQYYGYFQQQQFTWGAQTMTNHNKLLGAMPGVDGIKTGFTNAAGFTLAASAVRDGRRLIAVVLGGPSGRARTPTSRACSTPASTC